MDTKNATLIRNLFCFIERNVFDVFLGLKNVMFSNNTLRSLKRTRRFLFVNPKKRALRSFITRMRTPETTR